MELMVVGLGLDGDHTATSGKHGPVMTPLYAELVLTHLEALCIFLFSKSPGAREARLWRLVGFAVIT